ncbi:MAG: hypothetical protein IJW32_06090 [Clostridia bacterium]|nr:hypothetical protein [Alphaproteobacteria bacterium]MBQ9792564.1 hypothetical protein [Clostridia bacterium]MBQ9793284.1 hypothetical protein [Clostridia bacterium]
MRGKYLLFMGILGCFCSNVWAKTEITIYNQDLALVKKNKTIELKEGINNIVFNEVAKQANRESAYVYGDDFSVVEQNFDANGINYYNLLKANVGNIVKTVRINKATGENEFNAATLLATDGVNPILKFDYGIESNFDGRVVFDDIPEGLNNTPVLNVKLVASENKKSDIGLAYLTAGFQWNANYVAKVNDDKTLHLIGRASINNNSGSDYSDVKVKLVAGEVNVVKNILRPKAMLMRATNSLMLDSAPIISEPQSLNGFYLYELPEETNLVDGQVKMVSFIDTKEARYLKEDTINSSLRFGINKDEFKNVHASMIYKIKNLKSDGLGIPLPSGKVSFYDEDKNGELQFIGEDSIANVAVNEDFQLKLGNNFDVFANGKVKKLQKISERKFKKNPTDRCVTVENMYLYDVEYEIVNSSKYETNVVFRQELQNGAKLIKENIEGKDVGNAHQWEVKVSADGKVVIEASFEAHLDFRDCN